MNTDQSQIMASQPIDNPGAVQGATRVPKHPAADCPDPCLYCAAWRAKRDADSAEPWTFERLAEIPFVRRWMVDFLAVAIRDPLCAQRLEELLSLHRQVRNVSPYRTKEEDDTASSVLARAKHLGIIEQDATLPTREEIPPMPAELRTSTPPSGLSAIMHDAYTHPRRHDPISLGEELDADASRLVRTGGVLTIDLGIGETIPAGVLDHRTKTEAHQSPGSEFACPGFGPGAKGPHCCDLAGEPGICGDCHCACHAGEIPSEPGEPPSDPLGDRT